MKNFIILIVFVVLSVSINAQTNCNAWAATDSLNAPAARYFHTSIWTGTEMIVWGGLDNTGIDVNTGGKYNPVTNSWIATNTTGAPVGRECHSAVWTGSLMIVWGGYDGSVLIKTGGRYNPATDSWMPTDTTNAPMARNVHTAVWTGSVMVIWGGDGYAALNTGGRYNPVTDTWTTTSLINAPAVRLWHSAVWTGTEMIIYGGYDYGFNCYNSGGKYDPVADTWTATSTVNTPTARMYNVTVWTGSKMIVWGGEDNTFTNTGGVYDYATDTWSVMSTTGAPSPRCYLDAVWTTTCNEMIVWGGFDGNPNCVNDGGRYDPVTDSWIAITTTNAPSARCELTMVWTGTEIIVWGGWDLGASFNSGGRFMPCCGNSSIPASLATSTSPICLGSSTTLGIIGGGLGTGANWNWYTGSCGGTYIISGASPTLSPTTTTTYWVRAEGTSGSTTCVSVTVVVNTASTPASSLSSSPMDICAGTTITLTSTGGSLGTSAIWNWYSGTCGGTNIGTGTSAIQTPSVTTTYYIRAEGACNSTSCASIYIAVSTASTIPTSVSASPASILQGNSTTLSQTGGVLGNMADWYWYVGSCGGTQVAVGSPLTQSPTVTTTYWVRAEGFCNSTNCLSITVIVLPTSVNTIETDNLTIYPNPAKETIYITNADKSVISIYNVLGEIVLSTSINTNHKTIDLSSLSEGTYIIKIVTEKEVVTKKLIIE